MVGLKRVIAGLRRQSGKTLSAVQGFPSAHSKDSGHAISQDTVLKLAESAYDSGNYALSNLYYNKLIELWGDSAEYRLRMAVLQKGMGKYEDARSSLLNAIKLDPKDARFYLEMAELYLIQKQYVDAAENYSRAVSLEPNWSVPLEREQDLRRLIDAEEIRDSADQTERIDQEERLDTLNRLGDTTDVDSGLFPSTRMELTRDHRPELVITFMGIHQRSPWGFGPVVRGIQSLRGYVMSIMLYQRVEIYIDGRLVHAGDLIVGPVRNERSDARLAKYAFNAWIDFSQFSCGWHEVIFRVIGFAAHVDEGVNWKKESLIVDKPLPEGFFMEAGAIVPGLGSDSSSSLVEQVRALPSVVAQASPNSYPGPIRNVAVLRLDGLGDAAVSVPFFLRLRQLLPAANIVVIASTDNADACRALNIFDEVIEVHFPESPYKQGRFLSKPEQAELIKRLASYNFDLAITGMVSDGPRELSTITGAPVTIGFGGDDPKSLNIYYDTRDPKSGANVINYAARYGMLTAALEVWLDSGARVQNRNDLSRDMLSSYGIEMADGYVVMHTGSRIQSTEWPGYAALANRIVDRLGQKVVYIANDPSQQGALSEQALSDGRIVFLPGIIPFDHFDAFLSYCSAFIGNDSGPGHLATLRGAKAIRIISARLGGSEWKSEMAGVCMFRRMPCAGCGSIPISRPEECTYDIACVKDITVDEVYDQVVRILLKENTGLGENGMRVSKSITIGDAA